MRSKRWLMLRPVLCALIMMMFAATVRADTISVDLVSVTPSAGGFLWTYEARVSVNSRVQSGAAPNADVVLTSNTTVGDWFTIYDFLGFTGVTSYVPSADVIAAGGTFNFFSRLVGATASTRVNDVVPPDSGGIPNLSWYYAQGLEVIGILGGRSLGFFSAESRFGAETLGAYSARDWNDAGAGGKASNVGQVAVPVPLPAAAWAGMALMGAIGTNQLRKRRKEALC